MAEGYAYSYKVLKERNSLLRKARQSQEYRFFEDRVQMFKNQELPCKELKIDQEVWKVMLEKALARMRENMKFATNEDKWMKQLREQIVQIKSGENYQSLVMSLSRPKTPDIDKSVDYLKARDKIKDWKKALQSEKKKLLMPLSQRIKIDRSDMKHSDLYLDYAQARHEGIASRVKTPDTSSVVTLSDWEEVFNGWKTDLEASLEQSQTEPNRRRAADVSKMKESDLYLDYSKALMDGYIPFKCRIPSPDPAISCDWKTWDRNFDKWRHQLQLALASIDEKHLPKIKNRTRKRRSSSRDEPQLPMVKVIKKEVVEEVQELCIDFDKVSNLDADTELLNYVQKLSVNYASAIDEKHAKSRGFIGLLVGKAKFRPCGYYNKDNSCRLNTLHSDKNNEKRIHSCALCYFVFCGMINMHFLKKCPLLNL